jgi:hypothetical protein
LTRQVRNLLLLVVLALAAGVSAQTHDMADVMRRAHAYVVAYEDAQLSSVVATEQYYQRLLEHSGGQKAERTLLSEFLIFQLPPAEDWFALRDVHQVDGSPIERGDVFARLCARSPNAINERAMEIVAGQCPLQPGKRLSHHQSPHIRAALSPSRQPEPFQVQEGG